MIEVVREYKTVDKKDWGDGPWQNEPDKIQGLDTDTGYDTLIVRNHSGGLCGYVGVKEGHPLFGIEYSKCSVGCDTESWHCTHDPESLLDVHGGITFSSFCQEGATEEKEKEIETHGVCHIPRPGEPDRVWWFGFDCAHSGDLCPAFALTMRDVYMKLYGSPEKPSWRNGETYKTRHYVEGQIMDLAKQLKAMAQ